MIDTTAARTAADRLRAERTGEPRKGALSPADTLCIALAAFVRDTGEAPEAIVAHPRNLRDLIHGTENHHWNLYRDGRVEYRGIPVLEDRRVVGIVLRGKAPGRPAAPLERTVPGL